MYHRQPYLQELVTDVLRTDVDSHGPFVVLAESIFYPEGGGQPADRGWIGHTEVVDVRHAADGEVRHYVDGADGVGGQVQLRLDWGRRFDHMQQHTAQHALSAVAEDKFGWATTSFHLGPEVCDVELAVSRLAATELAILEEAVVDAIRGGRPVTDRRVDASAVAGLAVRTRGLPAGHTGPVRLVEIEGLDLTTCGGTHVASTSEVETVKLLGGEPMRGGTRVVFVAGSRVRARLGRADDTLAQLRKLLGAADHELTEVLEARLERSREAERSLEAAGETIASATADGLLAQGGPLAWRRFDDPAAISTVAKAFTRIVTPMAALIAVTTGSGPFALAGGAHFEGDIQGLGRGVAERLHGRGGGSGALFQGRADGLDRWDETVAWLTAELTRAPAE